MTDETTVSSKYQVVIPKAVREEIGLEVGQKLMVIAKGGIISLVPVPRLEQLRGFAKGMNTEAYREEVDRL